MNGAKYIGLDVHQATISVTVLDATGKLVMETILETKAGTILQFIHGLRGSLLVTFEEGNHDLKNLFKGAAIRAAAVAGLSRSSTRLLLPKE